MLKLKAISFACVISTAMAGTLGVAEVYALGIDGLMPHRAVYDLSLIKASDRSGITGMNGRIVYEMTGSKCDGFSVRFRFFTEVQTARRSFTNDQRTTSYEDGDGRTFSFVNQSYLNGQLEQELRGRANRASERIMVKITKPEPADVELDDAIFMTEHIGILIDAANAEQSIVAAKLFDGSDKGDELVDTTAIIGKKRPEVIQVEGEPQKVSQLFKQQSAWPMSVSYFSTSPSAEQGEKLPIYQVSFLMHESGVSRNLKMRYDDYSLKGDLTQIEFLEKSNCD